MTLVAAVFEGGVADTQASILLAGEDNHAYADFFDIYAQSEHGVHHAGQPLRYEGAFGSYGRSDMLHDLSSDIDPLGHMPATERAFIELVRHEDSDRVSTLDIHLGRLTSLVHDLGECTHPGLVKELGAVVGDIPQGRKTAEQRVLEMRVWDTLIDRYYRGELSEDQIAHIRGLVTHEDNQGRFGLHAAFEAAHDTNTLRVGLRAGRTALGLLERGQTESDRFASLSNLGKIVTVEIMPRMENHATSFTLPGYTLDKSEALYRRIQAEL